MGIFDRFRSTALSRTGDGKPGIAGQDAARLIDQGHALEAQGRLDEAMQCYLEAIRLAPNPARGHLNRGNILLLQGDLQGALDAFRTALKHQPDYAGAYYNIGNALLNDGKPDEAAASYRSALEIQPDYAEVHCALGVALKELGQLDSAVASFRRALEINPDLVEAHINLGNALHALGQFEGAVATYRHAIGFKPDIAEVHNNLGLALKDLGHLEDSLVCYRQALKIKPDYLEAIDNLLFTLNYMVTNEHSHYLGQARQYGQIVSGKAIGRYSAWQCATSPERLRIGLVSGDLWMHSVGFFLEGLLSHIDPARIELIAYPTHHKEDELTARIKPFFSAWKPLVGKNDEDAASLIHADSVHVLLDISGHTSHNRLPVFAWKPAPVQVTWLGLPTTTGVIEMDYVLGDLQAIPPEHENHFTEAVWRLPDSYVCFSAPKYPLKVAPLPALAIGQVTFGSFNNLTKMTDAVVAVWARILQSVPDSRLYLKTGQLKDEGIREQTRQRFVRLGIVPERLLLGGMLGTIAEHLAEYNKVDIALDTFPYPGVTTSVEALWMGVPVLSLHGDRFLSLSAKSIAHHAGLPEWVARDQQDYVAKAVAFASDLESLAALRTILRQQVLASPLFDAPRFAVNFEDVLWGMWQRYQTKKISSV
jgi:protein O-GlcNAc transferase